MTVEHGDKAIGKQHASLRSMNEELAVIGLGSRLTVDVDADDRVKHVGLPHAHSPRQYACAHTRCHIMTPTA
jgi:hypothetical protein